MDLPRSANIPTTTMNGIEVAQPGDLIYQLISDSPTPMTIAPTSVNVTLSKPPTKAAIKPGITRSVSPCTDIPTIGATMITANPARAEPRAHVPLATTSGDHPIAEAANGFSATA